MDPEGVDAVSEGGDGGLVGADDSGRVYHGGVDDPWTLDFSANVNPAIPPGAARVYDAAFASARSYPADDYCEFRAAAAEHVGCEPRQVVPTSGGLGAIRLAVATSITAGDRVLLPAPSFGEYEKEVRLQGGEPLFADPEELLQEDPADVSMAVCCTPNNPTGHLPARQSLRAFADRCRVAGTDLLVDEAFLGFTEQASLAGVEGVIVARSLTKLFGLPGLRAGFAVATGDQRERIAAARPPWSLGGPAAAVGAHCLSQEAFVEETRERVVSERERMRERLAARFDVTPSAGPFLLLDAGSPEAVDDVVETARAEDVVVRDARSFRGLDSHVRVAVRLPEENDRLLDALDV